MAPGTAASRRKTSSRILAAIGTFWQQNGYGPTYRDVQSTVGVSSTSLVKYHVDQLVIAGLVLRGPSGWNRIIRPSSEGWFELGVHACPLCGSEVTA